MAVNTHHILACISFAPVIFFQHLAHRLKGFDQSQPLEIIMQIRSSVSVHWMTLRITPTTAAWLMMCKPLCTFLKEIHPFWVCKAETEQEVGGGLNRGGDKLHQSQETLNWKACVLGSQCLPLGARKLIPITKKTHLPLFELQRSCSSYLIPL